MANFNRTNQFLFNDCENRRIIMWNEINFSESKTDTVKMLTGGDLMHVNIKFKQYMPIYRTPILMLSNRNELTDPAFRDRVYYHYWRRADFLKEQHKKPNPLCWPILLKKYKIINY